MADVSISGNISIIIANFKQALEEERATNEDLRKQLSTTLIAATPASTELEGVNVTHAALFRH